MSIKTATLPVKKAKKEVATKEPAIIAELVKSFKGKHDADDVSKILGISAERKADLDDWVRCEGSNFDAIVSFTSSLTNIREVAYAFYSFGQASKETGDNSLGDDL